MRGPWILSLGATRYGTGIRALFRRKVRSAAYVRYVRIVATTGILYIGGGLKGHNTATTFSRLFALNNITVSQRLLRARTLTTRRYFYAVTVQTNFFNVSFGVNRGLTPIFLP